jgi:large subunit ribosomal protein LP0
MVGRTKEVDEKKKTYVSTFTNYTEEFQKIVIFTCDNVGSTQLQSIRKELRGKGVVLMGKNTLMKKAIQLNKKNENLKKLIPLIKQNCGLIFTNGDLKEIRDIVINNKVAAPAKVGQISVVDVVVPAQNTGMEPTKTSFFQALNIPTKITKGTVEIIQDYVLLRPGDKVDNSKASLLQMMNLKPFSYSLKVQNIYDNGSIYDPSVLDITNDVYENLFREGINNIASISLATNFPTKASIPHSLANAFKDLLSVSLQTEYVFKQAQQIKDFLKDPSKFQTAVVKTEEKKEDKKVEEKKPKEEEKKKESEHESGGDIGFGLFGEEEN